MIIVGALVLGFAASLVVRHVAGSGDDASASAAIGPAVADGRPGSVRDALGDSLRVPEGFLPPPHEIVFPPEGRPALPGADQAAADSGRAGGEAAVAAAERYAVGELAAGSAGSRPAAAAPIVLVPSAEPSAAPDPGAGAGAGAGAPKSPPDESVDRNFAIMLDSVSCGHQDLGPLAPRMHPKRGQFCLVRLTFQNIVSHTVWLTLSPWMQRATTSDNLTHWGDLRASEAATGRSNPFVKGVHANERIGGLVVFDVAKGVRIIKLHVRESLLSSGVDITVP